MVRDSLLTLAPWPLGPLAPWPLGPLTPWPLGPLALDSFQVQQSELGSFLDSLEHLHTQLWDIRKNINYHPNNYGTRTQANWQSKNCFSHI